MMAALDPTALLPLARNVIDGAADQLLNTTLVEVREKRERDIVTNVDLDIERRARARLLTATPNSDSSAKKPE